jgi:hypothetical protein
LNRSIRHGAQKFVERRSTQEQFPSRPRRLAKDHVRDTLALSERNQAIRRLVRLHAHDSGAERLGELDVLLQCVGIVRVDTVSVLSGRLDVDRVPAVSR